MILQPEPSIELITAARVRASDAEEREKDNGKT